MPTVLNGAFGRTLDELFGDIPSALNWCAGDGTTDETNALNQAMSSVQAQKSGVLFVPAGSYKVSAGGLTIPDNVILQGAGNATRLYCATSDSLTAGRGLVNFAGSSSGMASLSIDGGRTSPQTLHYADFGSNAHASALTGNSSVWIHPGAQKISLDDVLISHTGGYSILLDTFNGTQDIKEVDLTNISLENCRPHLFALDGGAVFGGSWTGGIFVAGDCLNNSSATRGLTISNLRARRVTGSVFWMHSLGFHTQHTNVNISNVDAEDIGRDVIELGNLFGGSVSNVTGHRIGYVTQNDFDTPVPTYVPGNYAVGLDVTGFARGVSLSNIAFTSVNGGGFDLDGLRDSTLSNISVIIPKPGDPQFNEDSVSSYGPANVNVTKGVQTGNSSLNGGAQNISIHGGLLSGCGYNALVLAAAKHCHVTDLRIIYPSGTGTVPVVLYSADSTADEKACYGNVIENLSIEYNEMAFAIQEQGSFKSADINYVFGTRLNGTNKGAFLRHASSSSQTSLPFHTNSAVDTSARESTLMQREGDGATSAWKGYKVVAGTATQLWQISDVGPVWNVSANGAADTGAITTGAFSATGFHDIVVTKRLMSYGGWLALGYSGTLDSAGDSLEAANANPAAYGLIRYNNGVFEKSSTTNGSAQRIWGPLVGASASVAGSNTQIQFNASGAFGASSQLTFASGALTTPMLVVNGGTAGTETLTVTPGYINSVGGFVTQNVASTAIQAPQGGVYGKYLIASSDMVLQEAAGPGLSDIGQTRIYMDSSTHVAMVSQNGGAYTALIGSGGGSGGPPYTADNSAGYLAKDAAGTARQILTMGNDDNLYLDNLTVAAAGNIQIRPKDGQAIVLGNSAAISVNQILPAHSGTGSTGEHLGSTSAYFGPAYLYLLTVTGIAGTASIALVNGYMTSADGYHTGGSAFNSIQTPSGGMLARSFTASVYLQVGQSSGTPSATTSDTLNNGAMFYDTSTSQLKALIAGTWTALGAGGGGGGSGVSSITGGTGVNASAATGAVTLSIGQSVGTSDTVVFGYLKVGGNNVLIDGLGNISLVNVLHVTGAGGGVNVSASSASNSIQTSGGMAANGQITAQGIIGTAVGYFLGASTSINSSNHFVGAGVDVGFNGISCGNYNLNGGFVGRTATLTDLNGNQMIFRGGILTTS